MTVVRPTIRIDPAQNFGGASIARNAAPVASIAGMYAAGESADVVQDEYDITRHELLLALWHEGMHERHGWHRWAVEVAQPALWSVYVLDPDVVPLPERGGWYCPACSETYERPCSTHVRADWVEALARAPRVDVVHPDGTHEYWSTHCRHAYGPDDKGHRMCSATTINGGPRDPAQCKICRTPCQCDCHSEPLAPTE